MVCGASRWCRGHCMTVASFAEWLKTIPGKTGKTESNHLPTAKNTPFSEREGGAGKTVGRVGWRNTKVEAKASEVQAIAPVFVAVQAQTTAPAWVAPTPAPNPALLAVPSCSNCEAALAKQWHGGYTMQCVGCMARLVLSARPSRHQQETMLACLERSGNGRPERPTRQQVLERLQRR